MGNESSNDILPNTGQEKINNDSISQDQSSSTSNVTNQKMVIETGNNNNPNTNNNIPNELLVNYKFEWKEGGNKVLITGDFYKWNEFLPLQKNNQTNNFEIEIKIKKQKHRFKFIVDDNWSCSKFYELEMDNNNNWNNIIDLTNFIPKEENNKENQIDKEIVKKTYNCERPKESDMNNEPSKVPFQLSQNFRLDLNTKQDSLELNFESKFKYQCFEKENLLTENSSFKNIFCCPHEKLSHCINECSNSLKNNKINYQRICCTERIKHKSLTLVYYRPKYKD